MALDAMTRTRTETDSLGSLEIPADAYWGIHTARALENFPVSKRPISVYKDLVRALAMVKQASARANREIGALDPEKADLIDRASQLVIDGKFHEQFVVGVIQGGAGTSTNMNANEVITNIALELAGREKGDYAFLSPIDDTNRSQSTNDVYPTAIKVGLGLDLLTLLEELDLLRRAFLAKAVEFHDVLKVGRTQLQDAVPMTLGQEFHGFATTLGEDYSRLKENAYLLYEINMGATAIGTGITTHPDYSRAVLRHLREISGLDLETATDLVESTSDTGAFMSFSSSLKRNAIKMSKICNDLRLLSSGPQAGFGEINLPARQAGSSIMPGKVNPVIPEVVNQVAFAVVGADMTVTMAVEARAAAAERVRAGHRALDLPVDHVDASRHVHPPCQLRRGHHGQPRAARRDGRRVGRCDHRAHPVHRLRGRSGPRQDGAADPPQRGRPRRRGGADVARGGRQAALPGPPVGSGDDHRRDSGRARG